MMRIEIAFTGDPSHYPDDVAILDFEAWPTLNEVAKIRARVLKLYGKTDRYVVDVAISEFEWGASAGDVVLLINLAASLVETYKGVRALFDWVTRKQHEQPYLNSESAEESARLRIATRWDVVGPRLIKLEEGETKRRQGWKFVFVDARDVKFTARILATKSGVPATFLTADWTAIGGAPVRRFPEAAEDGE